LAPGSSAIIGFRTRYASEHRMEDGTSSVYEILQCLWTFERTSRDRLQWRREILQFRFARFHAARRGIHGPGWKLDRSSEDDELRTGKRPSNVSPQGQTRRSAG